MSQITKTSKLYTFFNNTNISQFLKISCNIIYMSFILGKTGEKLLEKEKGKDNKKEEAEEDVEVEGEVEFEEEKEKGKGG